jgi:hypothetical protein
MRERSICFVVVLILFLNGEIFAQQRSLSAVNSFIPTQKNSLVNTLYYAKYQFKIYQGSGLLNYHRNSFGSFTNIRQLNPIKADHYSTHLSFFCEKELQFEKITAIPFRFRLGSVDYVDYLEQKTGNKK